MKWEIAMIEDDPIIRSELKTLLRANDYEIIEIKDFTDVVQTVKTTQPHLLLLDIKLPGESGHSSHWICVTTI